MAHSDKVAAGTAIWFYKTMGMNASSAAGDFADSTRILNKYECNGRPGQHLQAGRVNTYQRIRKCFGLPEATKNLYC